MGTLYRLTFPNGKAYIGITKKTASQRFADHVRACSRLGRHVNIALMEFGAESVAVESLASADDWATLCAMEKEAIAKHSTKWPQGYNMTDGGQFPSGLTDVSRAKLSANVKANPPRKGTTTSSEGRANMSAAKKGVAVVSDARKEQLRAAMTGNTLMVGRRLSDDHRKRIALGIWAGNQPRPGSKSGVAGVSFDKVNRKWRATITVDRKLVCFGRFVEMCDAVAARRRAEEKYFPSQGAHA